MKHILSLSLFCIICSVNYGFGQQKRTSYKVIASDQSLFGQVEVTSIKGLNSKGLDFSPSIFENGILFTSTRQSNNGKRKTGKKAFTDLYFAKKVDNQQFKVPVRLNGKINSRAHDGIGCYNERHQSLFFTRTKNKKSKRKGGLLELKIYSATKENGRWDNIHAVSVNKKKYSSCHPTFSEDGMTMIFASDRPGGHGGMDLYKSTFVNGDWQKPVNLGPSINSTGNELFPAMAPDGHLYFSSNGRKGKGGLDIYQAVKVNEAWEVHDLGAAFNSRKDDFGFVMQADQRSGYYSSNRFGGQGGDDIYYWSVKKTKDIVVKEPVETVVKKEPVTTEEPAFDPPAPAINEIASPKNATSINTEGLKRQRPVLIKNQITNKGIPGAIIKVSDSERHGLVTTYKTNKDGVAVIDYFSNSKYFISVSKEEYEYIEVKLTAEELSKHSNIAMLRTDQIEPIYEEVDAEEWEVPRRYIIVRGTVSSREAEVRLLDYCIDQQSPVVIGSNGEFAIEMECDCNYKITASQHGYTTTSIDIPLYNNDCDKFRQNKVHLQLDKVAVSNQPGSNGVLTFNGSVVSDGTSVRLEKIYYGNNDFELNSGAKKELDKLIAFLKAHPGMVIELSSHTDVNGSFSYNLELSEKRALAAVQYLISKGIDKKQIKPRGYGESKPLNHCMEGVGCSEKEHQENRRTEFRVIQFDGWTKQKTDSESKKMNSSMGKNIISVPNIEYGIDQYGLDEMAMQALNQLAEQMILHPSIKIAINAYTDQIGDDQYNLILSQKRAYAVATYLSNRGIPTTRFQANGFGESKILQKGRVTEIVVTEIKDSNLVVVYKE